MAALFKVLRLSHYRIKSGPRDLELC
jgi:hypothetical protein